MPIYLDFLPYSLNNLSKSDAAMEEWKLNENKLSSNGDERVQSGMHIEKWFITFQGDWFQKNLHVCLLLIYRKTDSENFKWKDIGLLLLWYFKVREVLSHLISVDVTVVTVSTGSLHSSVASVNDFTKIVF